MNKKTRSEISEIPNEVKILQSDIERVVNAFNQMNKFKDEHIRLNDIEYLLAKAKNLVKSITDFQGWFLYWEKKHWEDG
jgi:ElaB/YqjD/DUF883 family membrane-anchored ribosome-binding protein